MAGVERLYKNFAPSVYNITLAISKRELKFNGKVEVIGRRIGRPSNRLVVHAEKKYIKIISAKITNLKPKIQFIPANTKLKLNIRPRYQKKN